MAEARFATVKSVPSPIRSAAELMGMAHAMEVEAGRRYRELAQRMRLRGEDRLAALFDFLASVEDKHAAAVDRRAADTLGSARLIDRSAGRCRRISTRRKAARIS
jgi:hypothetical protein